MSCRLTPRGEGHGRRVKVMSAVVLLIRYWTCTLSCSIFGSLEICCHPSRRHVSSNRCASLTIYLFKRSVLSVMSIQVEHSCKVIRRSREEPDNDNRDSCERQ